MRVLPRFRRPSLKPLWRRWARLRRGLTVARVTVAVEVLLAAGALLFVFTGSRAAWLDQQGGRADAVAAGALLLSFAALHWLVRRFLLPRLERYFAPAPYDEHRILFDLGQEVQRAASLDALYQAIAQRIAESFEAASVALFVRDEAGGQFVCRVATNATQEVAPLAADAFVIKRLSRLTTPLVLEAAEFDLWERALSNAAPVVRTARAAERATLQGLGAHLLVQIKVKERLAGVLVLGWRRGQFSYAPADKEALMTVAAQLALIVENARLAERMVAEERLRRELALAAEVQRRLLPERPPQSVAVELAGFCQPARGVGGDYYDFIAFDNQQLGIAIADVAGKGIAAALLMSTVQATLRSLSAGNAGYDHTQHSLADMVATLNRLLCNSTGGANYVTFFYAQYDEATQRLAYVNAGHNPPFFFRHTQPDSFRPLSAGGMFVGMFEHCSYEQEVVQLQPGDVLIAFTDGLSEAQNAAGAEFDETRIREALAATACLPVNDIRDEMVRRVKAWIGEAAQYDDLTFVVMKVKA